MKTAAQNKSVARSKSEKRINDSASDEEVAVIVDTTTGAEYYMFMIDFFKIDKKSYVVMTPYEPESVKRKDGEIVILRSSLAKNGDQLYISIRNKKELESAFEVFFKRFEESAQ